MVFKSIDCLLVDLLPLMVYEGIMEEEEEKEEEDFKRIFIF